MNNSSINDLLTPISADDTAFTKTSKVKEADALDITVVFYTNQQKTEIEVFPENTIRQVLKSIQVDDGEKFTFINVRTTKETNKLDITMSEFDIRNGDTLMIQDDGPVA